MLDDVTEKRKGRRDSNDEKYGRDRPTQDHDYSNADGTETFPRRRGYTREQSHRGNYFTNNPKPTATH